MSQRFLSALQHRLNPLHLYCRLCDLGLPTALARSLSAKYERAVFRYLAF